MLLAQTATSNTGISRFKTGRCDPFDAACTTVPALSSPLVLEYRRLFVQIHRLAFSPDCLSPLRASEHAHVSGTCLDRLPFHLSDDWKTLRDLQGKPVIITRLEVAIVVD